METSARALAARPAHYYFESAPVRSPGLRSHRLDESRLHRVLNYIAQHVDEPVTAAQLAGVVYFSLLHFTRIFDATTGEARHVSQQRLKNAMVLLAAGKRSLSDRIIKADDAFLPVVRCDSENLAVSCVPLADLTLLERRNRCEKRLAEMKMNGTVQASAKESARNDGRRVPILAGGASFEESRKQGVAFLPDLTEQKRAEGEARESERRHREIQIERAHANRISTMGQLTASIPHEVNQPIAAMVTNAQAALQWLDHQPPNLEQVRYSLACIVKDGDRAREVIGRIRALIKKAPPRRDRLEINGTIREMIELTRGEAVNNGVLVQTELADGLPLIQGDRVHLQQVILNLIINAIEAMSGVSEGPRELMIGTSKAEPGVLVSVRDSGPGLPPANLEHVFNAFYTTKPSGLGLGLSICRSIIEAHGGRLWASANMPRGAIFQFTVVEGWVDRRIASDEQWPDRETRGPEGQAQGPPTWPILRRFETSTESIAIGR
jgi:C4-dicarboxylate-specific signal transduction histidine kinase